MTEQDSLGGDGSQLDAEFVSSYDKSLGWLGSSNQDPRLELHWDSAVRLALLSQVQAMAVVTAVAERSWQLIQELRLRETERSQPWYHEFESWSRDALDAMWVHVEDGRGAESTGHDPEMFPEPLFGDRYQLPEALINAFEFAVLQLSAETAAMPILPSQCYSLADFPVVLVERRVEWYSKYWDPIFHGSIAYAESKVLQALNPLRVVPQWWFDRDIAFVAQSASSADFVGLRERAVADVGVAVGLKKRLGRVVVPDAGPITSSVWTDEVRSLVEVSCR